MSETKTQTQTKKSAAAKEEFFAQPRASHEDAKTWLRARFGKGSCWTSW